LSFHTCWDIVPPEGKTGLLLADVLARMAMMFQVHRFDAEVARQSSLRRLAALESLGAPEQVLASYRDARPVAVVLADTPDDEFSLDFTIWPDADGSVTGIQVAFGTPEHQAACAVSLSLLAGILGWEAVDVSDEVA
jgi:hypothetical protein